MESQSVGTETLEYPPEVLYRRVGPDQSDVPPDALVQAGCQTERHLGVYGVARLGEEDELFHDWAGKRLGEHVCQI